MASSRRRVVGKSFGKSFGEFDADFNLKGDKSRQLLGHIQFDLFSHDATLTNIKGKFDSALVQPYLELPFRINSLVDLDIKKLLTSQFWVDKKWIRKHQFVHFKQF